jgi:transposase InsO family protein
MGRIYRPADGFLGLSSRRADRLLAAGQTNRQCLYRGLRRDYNESRPHVALGNLPPAEYATRTGTRNDITGSNAAQDQL